MTRAQAAALSVALEGQHIGHSVVFSYDGAGAESASVSLDTGPTYTGATLALLAAYCQQNQLALSIVVASMGVV